MSTLRPGSKRVTVNLGPKAVQALTEMATMSGDTDTDVVNDALETYAYLMKLQAADATLYVREAGTGTELERLRFL